MATKKETTIKDFAESKGFDKHQIIKETNTKITVAYGYSQHYHNMLIEHHLVKKTDNHLFTNGDISFEGFVEKHKVE